MITSKNIALLATGDEIVDGVILNTNAQVIASLLLQQQMQVSQHVVVRDKQKKITQAILALLRHNQALIITGGLGPTSDDRTRFALATALQQPLQLNHDNWQEIIQRLTQRYSQGEIPLSNQQQALFPQQAQLLQNPHGTAAGCVCYWQNKLIFMLPGPPQECLPMFTQYVLPRLIAEQFSQKTFFKNWLLFGVSESAIAEKLEQALAPINACRTGYRVTFPYVEFKLFSPTAATLQQGIDAISDIIAPYVFSDSAIKASDTLRQILQQYPDTISISDTATAGYLEQLLRHPELNTQLYFNPHHPHPWHLTLTGLEEYWHAVPEAKKVTLYLTLKTSTGKVYQETKQFLNFQQRNLHYAAEYACQFLLQFIK